MEELSKCENCLKSKDKLLVCGKCHSVEYCSKECQVIHWPKHKHFCGLDSDEIMKYIANCCMHYRAMDSFQINLQALCGINKISMLYIDDRGDMKLLTFNEFKDILNQRKNSIRDANIFDTYQETVQTLLETKTDEIMVAVEVKISEKVIKYGFFFERPPIN